MIEALLNSLWQGAAIVALAAGITALVPDRHAATRYAVWYVALTALAVLPFSTHVIDGRAALAIPGGVVHPLRIASHAAQQAANGTGSWVMWLWIAGVAFCAARLARSYLQMARIVRTAEAAPPLGRDVYTSVETAIPITARLLRPIVILPADLISLHAPDLAAIISHERAHIRRNDLLGNFAVRVVECVLFFNPWVYVIGRQLVREREAACDDLAVVTGADPGAYARCLARIALRKRAANSPMLTPSAVGSKHLLMRRIARLLDGKATQVKTNSFVVATAVAVFCSLGLAFQAPSALASTTGAACQSDASVLDPVPPEIPDSLLRSHPHSSVQLLVTVTAYGHASDVKMVKSSGNQTIDFAAAEAAAHSTYKPAKKNCKPVNGGKFLFKVQLSP